MSPGADALRKYLAPGEQLEAEYSATLTEHARSDPVSVGFTDRRVLCVSERHEVIAIDYDAISTVRSYPWTRRTYRGNDYRLVLGVGGLVSVLGLVGIVAFASTALVLLLSLLAIGGLGVAEYLRRNPSDIDATPLSHLDRLDIEVADWTVLRRSRSIVSSHTDDQVLLVAGSAVVSLSSIVGLVVLSASALVFAAILVLAGGVALSDYALRHREGLDGIEVVLQRTNEVTIRTVDGETINLRCDLSEEIDRALSRQLFSVESEPSQNVSLPTQ